MLFTEYQRVRRGGAERSTFDLTDRERQILCRLTVGESNKEIARALGLAEKTVRNHLHNIFGKMAVADRTQAAILALRYDLCAEQSSGIVARHGDNRFDRH
jgi:two-component system NarL family response regulator